jgi:endonuclease/exonuclease/phosphatase family metal-dependent hydrolase
MKTASILSLILLFASSIAQASSLKVTSLNVEWYGRGGVISGNAETEYRNKTLKDFLIKELPKTDVFVFQEITEPGMLTELFSELDCFTYDAGARSHQYVVMCAEKGSVKKMGVNHNVRLDRFGLRSALLGTFKFKDKADLNVIGVHLKAGPSDTEVRLEQIKALAADVDSNAHTLIIGDLNTYSKDRTGLEKDDNELMTDLLKSKNFFEIENKIPTYFGYNAKVFDRAWGANLSTTSSKVYGPCDENFKDSPFADKKFYERFVSDHCALQVEFELKPFEAAKAP